MSYVFSRPAALLPGDLPVASAVPPRAARAPRVSHGDTALESSGALTPARVPSVPVPVSGMPGSGRDVTCVPWRRQEPVML